MTTNKLQAYVFIVPATTKQEVYVWAHSKEEAERIVSNNKFHREDAEEIEIHYHGNLATLDRVLQDEHNMQELLEEIQQTIARSNES